MRKTEYKSRRILVIGLGKSGLAVANLLAGHGARVFVVDRTKESEFSKSILNRLAPGIKLQLGREEVKFLKGIDLVVPSPGIPPDHPLLREARCKKVPIRSELEVGFGFIPSVPVVAVTGTNGKTTTATLIAKILQSKFKKVILSGNVGLPLSGCINRVNSASILVLEVSSYQLEYIQMFRAEVVVFLNLTPDHLSHHKTMNNYIRSKVQIFKNQRSNDFALLNRDDFYLKYYIKKVKGKKIFFSTHSSKSDISLKNRRVICSLPCRKFEISLKGWKLPGMHNLSNALASAGVGGLFGIAREKIEEVLNGFKGVEHRLEYICTFKKRTFFNDSKATNVASVSRALESLKGPLVLIMGGQPKGDSYLPLSPLIHRKVRALVLLGESAPLIERDLGNMVPVFPVHSMGEAVRKAFLLSRSGDKILLSPAGASFDMYKNFEYRGRSYKRCIKRLVMDYS